MHDAIVSINQLSSKTNRQVDFMTILLQLAKIYNSQCNLVEFLKVDLSEALLFERITVHEISRLSSSKLLYREIMTVLTVYQVQ